MKFSIYFNISKIESFLTSIFTIVKLTICRKNKDRKITSTISDIIPCLTIKFVEFKKMH